MSVFLEWLAQIALDQTPFNSRIAKMSERIGHESSAKELLYHQRQRSSQIKILPRVFCSKIHDIVNIQGSAENICKRNGII